MNAYKQELFAQRTPYLQWLKAQETELEQQYGRKSNQGALGKQIHTLPFSSCMDGIQDCGAFCADGIYLFVKRDGSLSDFAAEVFAERFAQDADTVLVYADEDYIGTLRALYGIADDEFEKEIVQSYCCCGHRADTGASYRGAPWFKPEFSPDTLASFFYIGSVFAIRGDQILAMTMRFGSGISIYELVYRIFMDALDRKCQGQPEGIAHIPRILYTNHSLADAQRIDSSKEIRALFRKAGGAANTDFDKISIVIPSKDNAALLQTCLKTLTQYTHYDNYELIVVDNGSSLEQQACITEMLDALRSENPDLVIQYLYREQAFNFSAMCNVGAQAAGGSYLLFLNDDIEVIDTDAGRLWLDRMMEYARKNHVGAVGAKLYYPPGTDTDSCRRIQHVGITNMGIGPAHKLGGMADRGCMYHGHNTQNYDMLAVTAACMLVRKSVFDAAGGFDETFPVAYNDVELCFRLYCRGYFNVQVNEAVLLHRESVSRGQDTALEKQKRLSDERRRLYRKYPLLDARDPFYSPNLVQWKKDVEYHTEYLYAFDRQVKPVLFGEQGADKKEKHALFKKYDLRCFLKAKCKKAAKIYDRLTGYHNMMLCIDRVVDKDGIADGKITDNNIRVEGWFAVRTADNADIPRKLWLIYAQRNAEYRRIYAFDIAPKLREDVAALLEEDGGEKGTKNTALSGIHVNIDSGALKPGTYRVGVLCQRKLVCDPEQYVIIPDRNAEDTKEVERKV